MKITALIAALLLAILAYARFSPVRIGARHGVPQVEEDSQTHGGFTAVRKVTSDDVLARLTAIALATPRTVKVSDNPLRIVTRSRLMGFADITTVEFRDDTLCIHAHLTIGRSDFGVNKARVLDWLDRLGPL